MVNYLVALDGSEHSQKAFDMAVKLASKDDTLHLVAVVGKKGSRTESEAFVSKFEKLAEEKGVRRGHCLKRERLFPVSCFRFLYLTCPLNRLPVISSAESPNFGTRC